MFRARVTRVVDRYQHIANRFTGIKVISSGFGIMTIATKVLTVKELSDYLKVHPSTTYRLLKKGQLPAFKVGSDWRFDIEAVDRWRLGQGSSFLCHEPKQARS